MAKPALVERPYETLFIVPVDTPQKNVDALMEKVKANLAAEKGTFKSLQVWGRRRLTYPIKRQKDGIYIYFDYNGSNKSVDSVNSLFRVTDFVIRHLTVLRDDAPPVPAASHVGDAPAEAGSAPSSPPAAQPAAPAQTEEK